MTDQLGDEAPATRLERPCLRQAFESHETATHRPTGRQPLRYARAMEREVEQLVESSMEGAAGAAEEVAQQLVASRDEEGASGELFIISAPSGAGKTTLINRLLRGDMENLAFSVSHTTRSPRGDEVDGTDYHFVDHPTFESMIDAGDFLEWAEVHGNLYGTAIAEVQPRLAAGQDVILDIDVQGGEKVMAEQERLRSEGSGSRKRGRRLLRAPVHSVFVMPPSFAELEKRLRQRNQDHPEEISSRLDVSRWEMSRSEAYDYVIVNDDARFAAGVLASIIQDKRHRGPRMRSRILRILQDFQPA